MRSWVYGYFGHRNIGDEAILSAVLKHVPAGIRASVLSDDPGYTRRTHRVSSRLRPPLGDDGGSRPKRYRAKYWLRHGAGMALDMLVDKPCVYACGGTITDHTLGHVVAMERRVRDLGRLRCRVGLLGVGADALVNEADREAARRLISERVHYCSVRDRSSYDNLLELGVPSEKVKLAADIVFSLEAPSLAAARKGPDELSEARVAINLRPLFKNLRERGDNKPQRFAAYLAGCEELARRIKALAPCAELLPFSPEDDEFLGTIAAAAKLPVADLVCSPADGLARLGQYDLLVGMRLHSVVFGALANVPCVAIPYSPKVLSVANDLGLSGADALIVGDGTEMPDRPLDVCAVVREVQDAWVNRRRRVEIATAATERKRAIAIADMNSCWQALARKPEGSD